MESNEWRKIRENTGQALRVISEIAINGDGMELNEWREKLRQARREMEMEQQTADGDGMESNELGEFLGEVLRVFSDIADGASFIPFVGFVKVTLKMVADKVVDPAGATVTVRDMREENKKLQSSLSQVRKLVEKTFKVVCQLYYKVLERKKLNVDRSFEL